jgi:uncharacterized protein YndB with AHSA1/START domain
MYDIRHRISIDAAPEQVYEALTTLPGLQGWWTETTSGDAKPGGMLDFRFGDFKTTMKVASTEADQAVVWECVDSAPEWVGTRLEFGLTPVNGKTSLEFGHVDWRESTPFLAHCSMKWATFLLSLKSLVEKGEGRPFPRDLAI